MANVKFNVACPSCAANLVIRSSAAVGRKMECPKCKYRFVVPQPPAEDPAETPAADEAVAEKGKGKGKKKGKEKAKAGNNKALVGVVLGVLVLGGLGFAAWQIFGGDDKPVAKTGTNTTPNNSAGPTPGGPTPGGPGRGEDEGPGKGPEGTDPDKQPGPGTPGPGTAGPEMPPPGGVNPPPKPGRPRRRPTDPNSKDITNLLPGDTQSVWHGRIAELSNTPLYQAFFNADIKLRFKESLRFDAGDVREFVHAQVGADRHPFAVFQLRNDLDEDEIRSKMDLKPAVVVNGHDVYGIKSNAFLTGLAKSVSVPSILGTGKESRTAAKPLALCLFDRNTLIIAEADTLGSFLNDLKMNGYPEYKTELTEPAPPPPTTTPGMPPPGGPGVLPPGGPGIPTPGGSLGPTPPGSSLGPTPPGTGKPAAPGGAPNDAQAPQPPGGKPPISAPSIGPSPDPGPGTGPGPGPGGPQPPAAPQYTNFTSNPTFRTIDQNLKRALNALEDEEKELTALTYAELVDQRVMAGRDLSALVPPQASPFVANALAQVRVLGFSLTHLSDRKMSASMYLDHLTDDDAKAVAKNQLVPLLNVARLLGKPGFAVNDYTSGQQPGGFPGGGFPGGDDPDGERPGSFPGTGMPPGRGGKGGPGGSGALPRGHGDDELAQKPGQPVGSLGPTPGGPGPAGPGPIGPGPIGPGMPGPGFPGTPGMPGTGQPTNGSHIDVRLSGTIVQLDFDLTWDADTYNTILGPNLTRLASQFRGRMAISSGEIDAFSLAAAVKGYTDRNKAFPRGTVDRDVGGNRYGLAHPPAERVSFLAELLPFVGKAALHSRIQSRRLSWHAPDNLLAAEEWVPEFLNPNYTQDAWRATSEHAPGRALGATNYVGIAGLGLDAARYDPANPDDAKRVGLITYDGGARLSDCPDGLSNTMLMVQLPPTSPRPWIAGGGATLTGVEDSDDAFKPFVTAQPDGKRGAMVLMGDGSVRFVREAVKPAVFKAMATRGGGDSLSDFDRDAPKVAPTRQLNSELRPPAEPVRADPPAKPAPPKAEAVDADELKKFQGTWKLTAMSVAGLDMPATELPKLNIGMTVEGRTFTMAAAGRNESATVAKLDPTASPKQIDLHSAADNETTLGVYELAGPTTLRYRITKPSPQAVRPKAVDKPAATDAEGVLMTFEKAK